MWDKSIIFDTDLKVVGHISSLFTFFSVVYIKQTDKRDRNPKPLIYLLYAIIITQIIELTCSVCLLNEQRFDLDVRAIDLSIFTILAQLRNLNASTSKIGVGTIKGWQAYPLSWALMITFEILDIVERTMVDGSAGFSLKLRLGIPLLRCAIILVLLVLFACPGLTRTRFASFIWPDIEGQIRLESDSSNKDDEQEDTVSMEITEAGGFWPWMKKSTVLWKYIWPSDLPNKWIYLLTASLLVAVDTTITIWQPSMDGWYLEYLMLAVDSKHDLDIGTLHLNSALMACMRFSTSAYGLQAARHWVWDIFSRHREKHAREKFQEAFMKKDANFHKSVDPNNTRSAVDKAVDSVDLLDFALFTLMPQFAQLVGTMYLATPVYGVKFGQILSLIVALNLYIAWGANDHLLPLIDLVNAANTRSNRTAQDSLQGWPTVAAANKIDYMIGLHKDSLDVEYQRKRAVANFKAAITPFIAGITEYGQYIGIVVAVLYARIHDLPSSSVLSFGAYWTNIGGSLYFFATIHQKIALKLIGARQILNLLEIEPIAQYGNEELWSQEGDMVLDNLAIGYVDKKTGEEKLVIKGVSAVIKKGERWSVVGPSGAGKSTLIGGIDGSCHITKGSVYYAGQDLSTLKPGERQKLVASLQQDPTLFPMKIKDNINFFSDDDDSQENAERAANHACIHDLITKQPQVYDSILNDKLLSGGEKQRVFLARMFATKKPVLCLDEATSSLDSETKSFIENRIEDQPGRTVIQVTHSLETANRSDKIIVLQKGEDGCSFVAEQGSPAALLKAPDSCYAKLWKAHKRKSPQPPVSQNEGQIETLFNGLT